MELRHLRALAAIADEGTFTDAAILLGVSQAAVSRSIAQLEQQLGMRLIIRSSRRVAFTDDGTEVLLRARRALHEIDALASRTVRRTLSVGYAWAGLGARTGRLYRLWEAQFPGTELVLIHHNTPTAGLAEGICDAAIQRREPAGTGYGSRQVGLEPRVCAIPRDDHWARRRHITLREIATRAVAVNRRTGTTSEALFPDGAVPAHIVETADTEHWLETIALGKAVGVTADATAAHSPRKDVKYLPIKDAPGVPVFVVWPNRYPHPLIQHLVQLTESVYREN